MSSRPSLRWQRPARSVGAALVMAAGIATTAPVAADAAAASGHFGEYASGPGLGYDDIRGHATLVRTGSGRTIVTVEVQGLHADTTYAVHVHSGTCADLAGHYFFAAPVEDGDGPNADELWPGPVTANPAGNARGGTTVSATAAGDARSVVVHATPTGGPRIACADLE